MNPLRRVGNDYYPYYYDVGDEGDSMVHRGDSRGNSGGRARGRRKRFAGIPGANSGGEGSAKVSFIFPMGDFVTFKFSGGVETRRVLASKEFEESRHAGHALRHCPEGG